MSGNGFHGQMSDKFRSAVFIILSGGFQDAYTYCCRGGVFANAQTGNIVLMSAALFRGDWEAVVKYLVPVLSFLLGIAVAELVHVHYRKQEKIHWRQIVLLPTRSCRSCARSRCRPSTRYTVSPTPARCA